MTGQLGNVMSESSKIAMHLARQYTRREDAENAFFKENDVHLHVPEGPHPAERSYCHGPQRPATVSIIKNIHCTECYYTSA